MARHEQGPEKGKIRFILAEVEGNNQTLQDFVKSVGPMLNRPVQVPAPPKRISNLNESPSEPNLFTPEPQPDAEPDASDVSAESAAPEGTRRKRSESQVRDRNAGLAIIKTLNLRPDGKQSLREFIGEKKPQTQLEHITCYVYYMTRILEIQGVSYSHIFTCFKDVGERLPGDVPQTTRNAGQKGWLNTADGANIDVSSHGLNLVDHDLPAPASGGSGAK